MEKVEYYSSSWQLKSKGLGLTTFAMPSPDPNQMEWDAMCQTPLYLQVLILVRRL